VACASEFEIDDMQSYKQNFKKQMPRQVFELAGALCLGMLRQRAFVALPRPCAKTAPAHPDGKWIATAPPGNRRPSRPRNTVEQPFRPRLCCPENPTFEVI